VSKINPTFISHSHLIVEIIEREAKQLYPT
jgi:hypothetical protein